MKGKVITKVLNVGDKTKEMMIDYFEEFKRLGENMTTMP